MSGGLALGDRLARCALALGPLALALAPAAAHADPDSSASETASALPGATTEPESSPWGGMASASGAFDNPAFAVALGARYRLSPGWVVGVDAEWNPWASFSAGRVRPGVASAYFTGIRRWNACNCGVELRTTAHLGASMLLFDLYGAPRGSVGPLLGVSLLGLEIDLGGRWALLFEPGHVMVPVPQLAGAPMSYHQYRATLGIQFGG